MRERTISRRAFVRGTAGGASGAAAYLAACGRGEKNQVVIPTEPPHRTESFDAHLQQVAVWIEEFVKFGKDSAYWEDVVRFLKSDAEKEARKHVHIKPQNLLGNGAYGGSEYEVTYPQDSYYVRGDDAFKPNIFVEDERAHIRQAEDKLLLKYWRDASRSGQTVKELHKLAPQVYLDHRNNSYYPYRTLAKDEIKLLLLDSFTVAHLFPNPQWTDISATRHDVAGKSFTDNGISAVSTATPDRSRIILRGYENGEMILERWSRAKRS